MTSLGWMSIAEVAARFGVIPGTVTRWIGRFSIPVERDPGSPHSGVPLVRIRAVDVDAFDDWYFRNGPPPPWLPPSAPVPLVPAVPSAPDDADAELLTLPAVAARTRLPLSTVRRWANIGHLPIARRDPVEHKRQAWVRWSDVRAYGEVYFLDKPRPAWLDDSGEPN